MKPQRRAIDRLVADLAAQPGHSQPVGVVGVIVAWNFPLNLSFVPLTAILRGRQPRNGEDERELTRHLAQFSLILPLPRCNTKWPSTKARCGRGSTHPYGAESDGQTAVDGAALALSSGRYRAVTH